MRLLQINVTANNGSTGRIAEGIGIAAQKAGFDSWIAYGRHANSSLSHLIRIGSCFDQHKHALETRLFDNHGLTSSNATVSFLKQIEKIEPDLIHLHNIHGYYLNYKLLFQYIREKNIPVVWTLHDCWPFTGHCAHFTLFNCEKWKKGCSHCPAKRVYPASLFLDRSKKNFEDKKHSFTSVSNMTLVPASKWLDHFVSQSFLNTFNHRIIYNGIDTTNFSPSLLQESLKSNQGIKNGEIVLLGVAGAWSERKGLQDFIKLSMLCPPQTKIVLIGLTKQLIKKLPSNIIGIERTESIKQLAGYYSVADIFLNLTYEDNYPTTNLEAISCGTPCLTYRTGGSPESITPDTGFVVSQGDLDSVLQCIETVRKNGKTSYSKVCRDYALEHFRQEDRFQEYIDLYKQILHI